MAGFRISIQGDDGEWCDIGKVHDVNINTTPAAPTALDEARQQLVATLQAVQTVHAARQLSEAFGEIARLLRIGVSVFQEVRQAPFWYGPRWTEVRAFGRWTGSLN